MHQIFLYILFSTYYSANIVYAQHSTAEQDDLAQNCRQQLTVKQIQSTVENMLGNFEKNEKETNGSG